MDDGTDTFLFIMGCVFGGVIAFVLTMAISASHPQERSRLVSVCDYLGGHVEGKVCLVDNKVVSTKPQK